MSRRDLTEKDIAALRKSGAEACAGSRWTMAHQEMLNRLADEVLDLRLRESESRYLYSIEGQV
jgi:hypothetical protein